LEPDVRHFVFASTLSRDLLRPVFEKIEAEFAETNRHTLYEDLQQRIQTVITNSELQPEMLFQTIELAAIAYSIGHRGYDVNNPTTSIEQTHSSQGTLALPEERITIQRELEQWKGEWKQDFDNFEDSLKAGQMELVRLLEHNRPAASYEPYIAIQLGEQLYSRLHETTRRAIQLAEYLYNINQEPDGFALTAVRMAQGYENELNVRIIGPFVIELMSAGTKTYDAQGKSKEALIQWGKFHKRGMTLGSYAWYLGKDPVLRNKVSQRGFDADSISKDAKWVSDIRNEAAHDFACDRAKADDLRRRILCRDGVLRRLHPRLSTA
jgi:hypothetical protein